MTCENPEELTAPQDFIKIINYKVAELRLKYKKNNR